MTARLAAVWRIEAGEGRMTVVATLIITAILGRGARERFYVRLALGLAVALIAIRTALLTGAPKATA